mgnify:CR=1 FL=1
MKLNIWGTIDVIQRRKDSQMVKINIFISNYVIRRIFNIKNVDDSLVVILYCICKGLRNENYKEKAN